MQERYIATVDLGTSKLALCVAKVAGENVQVIYYKERPSDGMRYNSVFNPRRAAVPLRAAIAEAEDELQIKITQVVVGLPRYNVRQETGEAKIPRSNPSMLIEEEEIESLKSLALDSYPLSDIDGEVIYGAVPQSFSTDDVIGNEEDVVGTSSETLAGNFKIFVGKKKAAKNIDAMLNDAGVVLAQAIFPPAAVGEAVLKNDEMMNGVALMEMGAGITSVSIWQGGIMRYFGYIPFGGKSITNDIRMECAFDDTLAENIKLAFGACLPEKLQSMGDKILQINDEQNGTYENLPIKYLSEIITSRCREIVNAILFLIQESGFADRLRCGIVLTGGGANLPNLANMIKDMSGYTVRVGFPLSSKFSSDGCPGIGEAEASTSIGLVLEAAADPYLNCISDGEMQLELDTKAPATETAPAPAPAPEKDEPVRTTLFGEDEFEKIETKIVKEPRKRDTKPAKPTKVQKPRQETEHTGIIWKKITGLFRDSFDNTIGELYDEMGGNNQKSQ